MRRAILRRGSVASGAPSRVTVPAAAARSPASVCRVRVFPEPFLPRMAMNSRGAKVARSPLTSSRAPALTASWFVAKELAPADDVDTVLRLQAHDRPGAGGKAVASARVQLSAPGIAVVNTGLALLPQLDTLGPEAIAPPVWRPGNAEIDPFWRRIGGIRRAEAPGGSADRRNEICPRANGAALLARPGGDAARPGPR